MLCKARYSYYAFPPVLKVLMTDGDFQSRDDFRGKI